MLQKWDTFFQIMFCVVPHIGSTVQWGPLCFCAFKFELNQTSWQKQQQQQTNNRKSLCTLLSLLWQFFCPCEYHMDLSWNQSCLVGWSTILHGRKFNVGHYTQTFQPDFFTLAMLVGTTDYYHFIPFSLIVTLAGGTRSAQGKTCWLHFLSHFSIDQDEIWRGDEAIQEVCPDTSLNEVYWNKVKQNKPFNVGVHSDVFKLIWCKLGIMIDLCYWSLHFDTSLLDLELDLRPQEYEKAKTSVPIISQSFQLIWMEFVIPLRIVCVMSLIVILILSDPFCFQGREPYYY